MNPAGHLAGTITINANGDGVITMFDANGKAIFTGEEKAIVKASRLLFAVICFIFGSSSTGQSCTTLCGSENLDFWKITAIAGNITCEQCQVTDSSMRSNVKIGQR